MTGIRRTDNERSDRERALYMVCSPFAICSYVTTRNMTTRNIHAMMQGVEGDAMLKRKAYLDLLAAAVIAVASGAPAFAQQTGKTRVVSDEVRERCRAQVRAIGIRGMGGGGSAEKQRDAIMRQCLANGGRL
jgi:hypothetical protein